MLQTEFDFVLPIGYRDESGRLYRKGCMRLVNAKDEIEVSNDQRIARNEDYYPILLLSRIITKLGPLTEITSEVIEKLFLADLNYLQDFHSRINSKGDTMEKVSCEKCGQPIDINMATIFENQGINEKKSKVVGKSTVTEVEKQD
jgi:hypothetical protein